MSQRDLKIIVELQLVMGKLDQHKESILSQEYRVKHLKKQIGLKKDDFHLAEESNKEISNLLSEGEGILERKEKDLLQAKSHVMEVTNEKQANALDLEIAKLMKEIEPLQNSILANLEKLDEVQGQFDHCEKFIMNAKNSLIEIVKDSEIEIKKVQVLIDECQKEKKDLIDLISDSSRSLFIQIEKKFEGKDLFCNLVKSNCHKCGFHLDFDTKQSVEKQNTLILCPSCSRVFLVPSS